MVVAKIRRRSQLAIALALAALLGSPGTASAHHSFASFDFSKVKDLTGTVKQFDWTNPHMFIHLVVSDAQRRQVEWTIECGTPNINIRHGWHYGDLKAGDTVSMQVHPNRDGSPGGTLMAVTLADGRVLHGPGNDYTTAATSGR